MTTPQIRIIDGDTVTDRDMNAEEITAYEIMQDEVNALAEAKAAKAAAREALLTRLGITAEEAQLLLGGI
jgi:hypothetical protein